MMLRNGFIVTGILVFLETMMISCEGPSHSTEAGKTSGTPKFEIRERSTEPLLRADKPWESEQVLGITVIREGTLWRMWYASYDKDKKRDDDEYFCYAESPDGVHWTKPDLGLVEYGGNKHNNILISGPQSKVAANYVFVDEGKGTDQKYKLIYIKFNEKEAEPWWVYGGTSADGIHWSLMPKPLCPKNSDTQTTCIPDGDKYRLYTRIWRGGLNATGIRTIGYTESDHFGDFPDPVEIFGPDERDPKGMDFYTNAATKLTDRLYVMFPTAFYSKDQTLRSHLAWSRDGVHFTRYGREPVVNIGPKFDKMGAYVMPGAVPGDTPNSWWFYYFGTNDAHDYSILAGGYNGGVGRFLLVVEDEKEISRQRK
jgi:hypothetical protein